MTEKKRFMVENYFPQGYNTSHQRLIDKNTNEEVSLNLWKLANRLNNLHEENIRLQKEIEDLNWELTEIKKSEDENYEIMDGL